MYRLCVLSVLATVLSGGNLLAADPKVERFELDNGLTVILRPVTNSVLVACVTLFDVGELHDPPAKSGLGHLVEHVYVTAAAGETPASTADEWFARYSRQANAQTGRAYTIIAAVFPSGSLEGELTEAAARMSDLKIEPGDLVREVPRMEQELANMYGGMPALAAQNLAAGSIVPLAEGARKGGVPAQIATITVDEVRNHHRKYYKPANATLVLVGGFDAAKARKLLIDRFGSIERGAAAPDPIPLAAPSSMQIRRETVPKPAFGQFPEGIATIAFRAPSPQSELYAPFVVLVAKLYDHWMPQMRQRSMVMPFSYALLDLPEVLFVSTAVEGDRTDEEVVAAIRRDLAVAATVPDGERPSPVFLMQLGAMLGFTELPELAIGANPYFLAFSLGRREQLGIDPDALKTRIDAVTTEQLQRCAKEIFSDEHGAAVVVRIEVESHEP